MCVCMYSTCIFCVPYINKRKYFSKRKYGNLSIYLLFNLHVRTTMYPHTHAMY